MASSEAVVTVTVTQPYGIWGGLSELDRELLLERGTRRASSESVRVGSASRVPRLRRRAARRRLRTFHELHSPNVTPAASAVPIANAPNTAANPTACWSLRIA